MGERLRDKVAIVTGAASVIGAATAALFVEEGAWALLADRDGAGAEHVAATLDPTGEQARGLQVDVQDEAAVAHMVRVVVEAWGCVDILVNNAGVSSGVTVEGVTEEAFETVMGVNVLGPMLCAKHALPLMLAQGHGAIVNVASISATFGIPGQAIYGPSKGAVLQLTRQLAVEYAQRGIRVNAVSPGTIVTPMTDALRQDPARRAKHDFFLARHPIGRFGQPDEVASAILFLASDEASFITGANLPVDGGYTAM
jgi:NAD(P)-dependent dehydrogenase (short-subunit alcohol dehydrogenase family)